MLVSKPQHSPLPSHISPNTQKPPETCYKSGVTTGQTGLETHHNVAAARCATDELTYCSATMDNWGSERRVNVI